MTSDESIAQYYLRFCKCAAECDNGFDEAGWKREKNSIFDRFMNTIPEEIKDALELYHTRADYMLYTPTACITEMNRIIIAMSKREFRGRYSGDPAKRKKGNDDDAVSAANAENFGPWNKEFGRNFNVTGLSQEHRRARYAAKMCFNCGNKNHNRANCPHDNSGSSKPGSHGTGSAKAKVKAKGKGSGKGAKGGRN